MLTAFLTLLKIFAPILLFGLFYGLSANAKPKRLEGRTGTIQVNRPSIIVLAIFGLSITALGAYFVFRGTANFLSVSAMLFGMAFTVLCLTGLTRVYDVIWDETGVTGPSTQLPIFIKKHRTQISWTDIIAAEENFIQNRYIKSTGNQKIFWNYVFNGHSEFERALHQNTGYSV